MSIADIFSVLFYGIADAVGYVLHYPIFTKEGSESVLLILGVLVLAWVVWSTTMDIKRRWQKAEQPPVEPKWWEEK